MEWLRPVFGRWRVAVLLVAVFVVPGAAPQSGEHKISRTTWSDYGGGPDNARYMTLDQITRTNVTQLEVAWTYPTRDSFSYVFNPLIVDNVMYVLARNSAL